MIEKELADLVNACTNKEKAVMVAIDAIRVFLLQSSGEKDEKKKLVRQMCAKSKNRKNKIH